MATVPVVTMGPGPAIVNPPAPALSTPLTQDSIEKIVEGIFEMQQQLPEQNRREDRQWSCLWTAQVSI